MLKPSEFEDKQKGINKFLDIIESQIEEQDDLELKKDFNEKRRRTSYLDTDNFRHIPLEYAVIFNHLGSKIYYIFTFDDV